MVFITRDLPQEAIEATLTAFEKAVEEPSEPRSSVGKPAAGGSRREFLAGAAGTAATTALASAARAVIGPDDKFDLVIKGGEVIDLTVSM
jgi:hypothetical protein